MAAKMIASSTEMNVKNADAVASLESVSKVLGNEEIKEMIVMIAEKPIVHIEWFVMVFKYFAPVRTWRPWINVLFKRNIAAVAYQTHFQL